MRLSHAPSIPLNVSEQIDSDEQRYGRVSFGRDIRALVWLMTRGRCYYCGVQTNPFVTFTVDHVRPLSRGGSNELRNLVPCCSRCNTEKGTKCLGEWVPRKPFWFLSDEYRDHHAFEHHYTVWEWECDQITDTEEGGR